MVRRAHSCCRTELRGICRLGIEHANNVPTCYFSAPSCGLLAAWVLVRNSLPCEWRNALRTSSGSWSTSSITLPQWTSHTTETGRTKSPPFSIVMSNSSPPLRISRMAPTPTSPSRRNTLYPISSGCMSHLLTWHRRMARCAGDRSSSPAVLVRGDAQISAACTDTRSIDMRTGCHTARSNFVLWQANASSQSGQCSCRVCRRFGKQGVSPDRRPILIWQPTVRSNAKTHTQSGRLRVRVETLSAAERPRRCPDSPSSGLRPTTP